MFIYGASEGEIAYVSEEISEQVEEIVQKARREESDEDDECEFEEGNYSEIWGVEDELAELTKAPTAMTFMIVNSGMACGPAQDVCYVGFSF